ncbi:GreA/GreB family elongation factor [Mycobacterium sp. 1245805.9]|uniref:GreA/GreB family elongation factor n=1 Tax=Mycobacterium sp. 1245805.9 TaxID=1856862 RepID=UPI0007FFDA19|nr:GreA/GreB family elongation factor [Mycobacterium sp. 1245805.9]OBI90094.1 transcription elongation factor GreA [Mycobacterium sp. 1245805.9]
MRDQQGICLTRQEYGRLLSELTALRSRRSIEVPDDFMDYDANRIARYSARRARIRAIEDLLARAIVADDTAGNTAEPGMTVTIRYEDSGETETFRLGRYGAKDGDTKVYSTLSPLGRAIAGARPGERRVYSIPDGANLIVTLISAEPDVAVVA